MNKEYSTNLATTFITPEGHKGFSVKKLFGEMGKIWWGAIAYIEKSASACFLSRALMRCLESIYSKDGKKNKQI